jgi:enoyl-CoA hydratase/3-hydroxyacyl-CoA dehydrogenase
MKRRLNMADKPIETIVVIGAGDMGHGIAEVALIAGYTVHLYDIKQEFVDRGVSRIQSSLRKLVEKGKVSAEHEQKIDADLLKPTTDLDQAAKQADLCIEAAPESPELKKQIFTTLDQAAPDHAILASNTSTIRITDIASATTRPGKVVGLHYFNPAVLMRLVEVIRGEGTDEATMEAAVDFVNKTGKVPVRVEKDVPGFIVNRVQAPSTVLLGCIVDQGIAQPEQVDAVLRNLGMPMGPFEIMDFTGLDIAVAGSDYFAQAVHPDFAAGKTLKKMVESGNLGKKAGKGFFDWSQGRPPIDLTKTAPDFDVMDLVAVNINEAAKLIEAGVCSAEDVDTAIVNGTGNAVGPMTMAKSQEPADLTTRLEKLAARFNKEIFKPVDYIKSGAYR